MVRKLLSLVVALAVVLSSMSFAFAATPAEVAEGITDAKVKAAVEKLAALGMTQGMEDGKYHPELKLTRAQGATFIVRALGLEAAATAAAGTATPFSDVAASHWAAGYINVAAGQGLVTGMGDGTFAPEMELSYAHIITMLVRALGYQDNFLKGTWPGNYLAKAADAKITDGVGFTPDGKADRGAVAMLLGNTLEAKVVRVVEYSETGVKYGDDTATLLEKKLNIFKFTEGKVTENERLGTTGTGTKTGYARVEGFKFKDASKSLSNGLIKIASAVDTEAFLGVKSNVFVKEEGSDKTIVHIEQNTPTDVIFDKIDKKVNPDSAGNLKDVKLRVTGKTLSFDDDFVLYINGSKQTEAFKGELTNDSTLYGKWVVEGSKVVFAELYRSFDIESALVHEVNGSIIKYYPKNSGSKSTLDLSTEYAKTIIYQGGKVIKAADIKPMDVLYINKVKMYDSKDTGIINVIRASKTGKAGNVKGGGSETLGIEIDGSNIDIAGSTSNQVASVSKNNNEDVEPLHLRNDVNVLDDMYGKTITAYRDYHNNIRHIVGDITTTGGAMYGVVTQTFADMDKVTIFTSAGEKVTYNFDDVDNIFASGTEDYATRIVKGIVIKYELNKDGKIAKDSVATEDRSTNIRQMASGKDFGKTDMTVDSNEAFFTTDKTLVFDYTNASDLTKLSVSTWSTLAEKKYDGSLMFKIFLKKNSTTDVEAIFVTAGAVGDDDVGAYVLDALTVDGDPYFKVHVFGTDKVEVLKSQSVYTSAYDESVRVVKRTSGDKLSVVTNNNFSTFIGRVTDIDGRKITVNDGVTTRVATVADNVVVYQGTSKKSFENIQVGHPVALLLKGNVAQAIEWEATEGGKAVSAEVYNDNGTLKYKIGSVLYTDDIKICGGANGYTAKPTAAMYGQTVTVWQTVGELKIRAILKP